MSTPSKRQAKAQSSEMKQINIEDTGLAKSILQNPDDFGSVNSDMLKLKSKIEVVRVDDDYIVIPPSDISDPFSISEFCYGRCKGSNEAIAVAAIMCPAGMPTTLPYFPMPCAIDMTHPSWRKYVYNVEEIGSINIKPGKLQFKEPEDNKLFYEISTGYDPDKVYGLALHSMDLNPRYLPVMHSIIKTHSNSSDDSIKKFALLLNCFMDSSSGTHLLDMDPLTWSVERALTMSNILAGNNYGSTGYGKSLNSLLTHLSMHIDPANKEKSKYLKLKTEDQSIFEKYFYLASQSDKSKAALLGNRRQYVSRSFEKKNLNQRERVEVMNHVMTSSKTLFSDFMTKFFGSSVVSTRYLKYMYKTSENEDNKKDIEEKIKQLNEAKLKSKTMIIPSMLKSMDSKYNFMYIAEDTNLKVEKGIHMDRLVTDTRGSMSEIFIGSKTIKVKKFDQTPDEGMPAFMKAKPCCF